MPDFDNNAPAGIINIDVLMTPKKLVSLVQKNTTVFICPLASSYPDCRVLDISCRRTRGEPIGFCTRLEITWRSRNNIPSFTSAQELFCMHGTALCGTMWMRLVVKEQCCGEEE